MAQRALLPPAAASRRAVKSPDSSSVEGLGRAAGGTASQGYFCPALWAGGFLGCCKTAEQRGRALSLALWGLGAARGAGGVLKVPLWTAPVCAGLRLVWAPPQLRVTVSWYHKGTTPAGP